jgi:hypothetical protein
VAPNGRQRVAQFVAGHGQELLLESLNGLALADVADDRRDAAQLAERPQMRSEGGGDVDACAGRVEGQGLEVDGATVAERRIDRRPLLASAGDGEHHLQAAADGVGGRVAEQALGPRIPGLDDAVGRGAEDGVVGLLDDGGEALSLLPRAQQLALVGAAGRGVEHGAGDQPTERCAVVPAHRVHEDRQGVAPLALDVERDLVHEPLQAQQGRVLVLVEEPPRDRQEVLEAPDADQLFARVAGPGEKGLVYPQDHPVGRHKQEATRRVLVEFEQALSEQVVVHSGSGAARAGGVHGARPDGAGDQRSR